MDPWPDTRSRPAPELLVMGTCALVLVGHSGRGIFQPCSSQEVLSLLRLGTCEPGQTLPLNRS